VILYILSVLFTMVALIFMLLGIVGLFRFKDFYSRILISSKVETVGFITIMTGVMLYSGFTWFSLKVLLILIIALLTNPLSTHAIARSAFISGYKIKREEKNG